MSQWGFYYDQTRCFNCKACVFACKSWNDERRGDASINVTLNWLGNRQYDNPSQYEDYEGSEGGQNYKEYRKYHMKENWRRVTTQEYGTVPPEVDIQNLSVSCNHCEDPACIKVCPVGCITKEDRFGAVLVKNDACISCGRCREACPWDAPQYYDENFAAYALSDPARPRMTKCTLCYERINEGLKPACVAACVGRALEAGDIDALRRNHPDAVETVDTFASDEVSGMGTKTYPNIIFKARKRKV